MDPNNPAICDHKRARSVGQSAEGMGHINVKWCPDCGALKRTMINWKCTDYPWELPQKPDTKPA